MTAFCRCCCAMLLACFFDLAYPHIHFIQLYPFFILVWTFIFLTLHFSSSLCCTVISTEPFIITGHLGAVGRDEPAAHQMTKPTVGKTTRTSTVTPLMFTNCHVPVYVYHTFTRAYSRTQSSSKHTAAVTHGGENNLICRYWSPTEWPLYLWWGSSPTRQWEGVEVWNKSQNKVEKLKK